MSGLILEEGFNSGVAGDKITRHLFLQAHPRIPRKLQKMTRPGIPLVPFDMRTLDHEIFQKRLYHFLSLFIHFF